MTTVRVDWFRVLVELQQRGYSVTSVSAAIDVPKATVMGWRTLNAEPSHVNGERLIGLWIRTTGQPREALPLNVADLMSAARAASRR